MTPDTLTVTITKDEIEAVLGFGSKWSVGEFWPTLSEELPRDLEDFVTNEIVVIGNKLSEFLEEAASASELEPIEPSQYLFDIKALITALAVNDPDSLRALHRAFVKFVTD
jgi:hypothetical protein